MDKKSFVNMMQLDDKNLISNLYEKFQLSYKTGKTIYCNDFYTPNIWRKLEKYQVELGIKVINFGLFEEAERRMIAFSKDEDLNFPIKVVCIRNKSKFSILRHKDYLGAIMSLGIKREKIGDIVVNENCCFLPICSEISDYIFNNLETIGNSPCSFEFMDYCEETLPHINYEEKGIIVSSTRIDCMISSLCNISRNSALEMINTGKVLIDYEEVNSKEKKVQLGNVIIIRGYGKFKIAEETGNTQKGRIRILIKKYI